MARRCRKPRKNKTMACIRSGVGARISDRLAMRVRKNRRVRGKVEDSLSFSLDYLVVGELRRPKGRGAGA